MKPIFMMLMLCMGLISITYAQSNAPKSVLDGFNKAFACATIKEVYKIESKEGKNYFEIEYSLKRKNKEAKIDPSGKIM